MHVEVPKEAEVSSNMEVLRINNENEASKSPVATQAIEDIKKLLNSLFKFKAGEPLAEYIATKVEDKKDVYTLNEVLTILKNTIRNESMFDEFNPSIILCDPNLEEALGMKALHVTQIRDLVLEKLEKISDPPLTNTVTPVPSPSHAQSHYPPSIQPTLSPGSVHSPPSIQPTLPPGSVQPNSEKAPTASRQLSSTPRPNVISSNIYNNPSARFSLKPDFLAVILSVPGVDPHQDLFSYYEVTVLLSKYIIDRKYTIFDERNMKVALVANDLLGKAFNVAAFHRCQVTNLLRSQLVHVEEPAV